jgi:ribulose-5-phosphate 4-epimerase/fuculose-1-phosphate aldolase
MSEHAVRENIVKWGKSLFDRGLNAGSSGNISVRIEDGYLATHGMPVRYLAQAAIDDLNETFKLR